MWTVKFKCLVSERVVDTFTDIKRISEAIVPSHIVLIRKEGVDELLYPVDGMIVLLEKDEDYED